MAKPILSGYDFEKKPVYFEESSIVSYGKFVTGTIKYKSMEQDVGSSYSSEVSYIYFCPFDSLESTLDTTIYYDSDGKYDSSTTSDISERTYPISLISNTDMDDFNGLSGFRKKLKAKCTKSIKKFPRIEIPIVRSETALFQLTFDTIKTTGGIKSVWLKEKGILGEISKKSDGSPLLIGGKEWKKYSFVKDANYMRSEFQVNCKNQTTQITQVIEYSLNGSIVSSKAYPLDVRNMNGIVPNSIAEDISKFICSF